MKKYYKELVFGISLTIIFVGLVIWFIIQEPTALLPISIAIIIILVGIATFIMQVVNKKRDIAAGAPADDEFTKLTKVYAGNRAFRYGLYLWMLIFVINSSFTKHETMLGIGILGSVLIYYISLWYYKVTGGFNEE